MQQNPYYQRALLLLQQDRFAEAENELRQMLVEDPGSAWGHATLAIVLLEQLKLNDATAVAERAIVLDPGDSHGYYAMAMVMFNRNRYQEAQQAIDAAIRIDPFDPRYFALLGQIKLAQRNFTEALAAANNGLEIDADHTGCLNIRGIAQVHLGDGGGAAATIHGALERDPQNAVTHANQGWALMHRNEPKKAMEHFRESLRLDPNNDWAKAGIIEAMKARNPIYRMLMIYFLFMARQSSRMQWVIIIGGYIGYRVMLNLQKSKPELSVIVIPLILIYIVFVISTWLAPSLMNMLMRFDRFGKYALSNDQIRSSNLVALLLVTAIGFFIAWLCTGTFWISLAAVAAGLLAFPASAVFSCDIGWPRKTAMAIVAGLLIVGILGIWQISGTVEPQGSFPVFMVFMAGIFISQFVMMSLVSAKVRK